MKYLILIACITVNLVSCATYRALPKGSHASETKYIRVTQDPEQDVELICEQSKYGTKSYCRSEDELFYVHIDPYQAVTCQKIEFYGECGKYNSGSLWWNFGDNTTSSLKNGWKTYESAGTFEIEAVCTFVDGTVRSAKLLIDVTSQKRGSTYSSFPGYWYNWDTTEIKTGDTSCPRIELK